MAVQAGEIEAVLKLKDEMTGELKKINSSLGSFTTIAKTAGAAVVGMFSVQAIQSAVTQFTELTGKLSDLSAKTGISTTELQKLKYAADLSGSSLEGVTKAVSIMARNLVEGDKSAVEAMKRLGLNIMEVRQMEPGQAFAEIADAIAKVESPLEQSTLAMKLFGKSGADILPMIKGNMTETMLAAERLGLVLDESTVAAGDRLGDTFTTLQTLGTALIGKALAPMLPMIQAVADNFIKLSSFVTNVSDAFRLFIQQQILIQKVSLDMLTRVTDVAAKIPILGNTMREVDKATVAAAKSASAWLGELAKGFTVSLPKTTTETRKLSSAVGLLTDEQKKGAKATKELGEAHVKAALAAAAEWERLLASVQQTKLGVPGSVGFEIDLPDVKGMTDLWQVFRDGIPVINGVTDSTERLFQQIDNGEPFKKADSSLRGLSQSLANLAQVSGGAFGTIVQGLASVVGAIDTVQQSMLTMAKGGWQNFISGIAGIGAAIGTGINLITNWVKKLNAGRTAVKDFASSFGGFDALRAKLSILGDEGERMWIALTQGVGRGNPEQAKAVIADVGKALENIPQRLNEMVSAALLSGESLDAAMLPFIEQLIRTGELTEANKNLLMGLPAAGVPSFDEVSAAAERLGLNIDSIGQGIKQMGFTELADSVARDLDILSRAGADMNAVLTGSRDKIQKLVHDAQQFGYSLPESIKPFLQQMVNAGSLTDLFGDQLTDLEDLHFTKPLEDSVEDLIAALHELVGVIRQDVGGALDELGNKVVRPRVEIDQTSRGPLPELEPRAAATAGGTAIIEVDGQMLARAAVPFLADEVQRYGLA